MISPAKSEEVKPMDASPEPVREKEPEEEEEEYKEVSESPKS